MALLLRIPDEPENPAVRFWRCDECQERFGKLKSSAEDLTSTACPSCAITAQRAAVSARAAELEVGVRRLGLAVEIHRRTLRRKATRHDTALHTTLDELLVELAITLPVSDSIALPKGALVGGELLP